MKRGMTTEYLMSTADLSVKVDFGVNGAIGAIVTKWDLILKNKNKKNKNTFISEKKCNIIIIFIKYVTYNSFLETAIMGSAA